jgi:hypothetical protein
VKNIRKLCFILILFSSANIYSQIENIPADNQIYNFLSNLSIQGILDDYDDIVLPLPRGELIEFLDQLDKKKKFLSATEKKILDKFSKKIRINDEAIYLLGSGENFGEKLTNFNQKHLYYYLDSSLTFFINPLIEFTGIHAGKLNTNAALINIGGEAYGSYDGWLGYRVAATNGIVLHSREAALYDQRVEQSFTFNQTGINYFDGTEGYIRLEKGIVNLQLGRERIYWGRGNIDQIFLGSNPPLFDFLKFNFAFKDLRYDFIHGWLTQQPEFFLVDTLLGHYKFKDSKYFAISRLGYYPIPEFGFGISQVIVYANRPFEAAYLNPFLFWESAQRSLNDLDNSFLGFDTGTMPLNGFQIDLSVLLDDIDFDKLGKGKWNASSNALALDAGGTFTYPLLPKNTQLKLQYMQIRPYMFSHYGRGQSLAYSNNGYVLGTAQPPNSVRLNSLLDFFVNERLNASFGYSYTIHGRNVYDENGILVRNVGGNPFEYRTIRDSETAYLLDGDKTYMHAINAKIDFEILYGLYVKINYEYLSNISNGISENENIFRASLLLNLN